MRLGELLFRLRGFTPVPLIVVVLYFAHPTNSSFSWGIAFMVIGELIRLWGVAYAGGVTRTRNVGAPELIVSGPFARVRNPLYLGNMFMYTGAAVIANVWMPFLILVVWLYFGFQYYFIVKVEESKLVELFGEEYNRYREQVPTFIPRLKPAQGKSNQRPDFANALRSEKSTFLSFVGILLLFYLRMRLD